MCLSKNIEKKGLPTSEQCVIAILFEGSQLHEGDLLEDIFSEQDRQIEVVGVLRKGHSATSAKHARCATRSVGVEHIYSKESQQCDLDSPQNPHNLILDEISQEGSLFGSSVRECGQRRTNALRDISADREKNHGSTLTSDNVLHHGVGLPRSPGCKAARDSDRYSAGGSVEACFVPGKRSVSVFEEEYVRTSPRTRESPRKCCMFDFILIHRLIQLYVTVIQLYVTFVDGFFMAASLIEHSIKSGTARSTRERESGKTSTKCEVYCEFHRYHNAFFCHRYCESYEDGHRLECKSYWQQMH